MDDKNSKWSIGLWGLGLLVLAGLILMAIFFDATRHWLAVHTGTLNEPGPYYGFWSGFGSDLGEATLIATVFVGVLTGFRKVNCHSKGCWRIGHHPLEGTPYHLCSHHHPDVPNGGATHAEILELHRRHKEAGRQSRPPAAPGADSPVGATPAAPH